MTPYRTRRSPGFTLLELVVVVALAGLVTGFATLFFANTFSSAKLSSAARELSAVTRQMKAYAETHGEDRVLVIDLDARQYGPDGGRMRTVPAVVSITVTDPAAGGEIRSGIYRVLFPGTGGAEGGEASPTFAPQFLQNNSSGSRGLLQERQDVLAGTATAGVPDGGASSSCGVPQFRQNFAWGDTRLPHSGQYGMIITKNKMHVHY